MPSLSGLSLHQDDLFHVLGAYGVLGMIGILGRLGMLSMLGVHPGQKESVGRSLSYSTS